MLTVVAKKTNQDEILKCIVFAGCKNDKFPDPDAVYLKLPEFCQYDHEEKMVEEMETKTEANKMEVTDRAKMNVKQAINQLIPVFDNYFLKKRPR